MCRRRRKKQIDKICALSFGCVQSTESKCFIVGTQCTLWSLYQRWKYAFHTRRKKPERNHKWTLWCLFHLNTNWITAWTLQQRVDQSNSVYAKHAAFECDILGKCIHLRWKNFTRKWNVFFLFLSFSNSIKHLSYGRTERKMLTIW